MVFLGEKPCHGEKRNGEGLLEVDRAIPDCEVQQYLFHLPPEEDKRSEMR